MSDENDSAEWGLKCSFWIDTDGYSDRDREMFVCGFEFAKIFEVIDDYRQDFNGPIHSENEDRVRMACAKFRRPCEIDSTSVDGWVNLRIEAGFLDEDYNHV